MFDKELRQIIECAEDFCVSPMRPRFRSAPRWRQGAIANGTRGSYSLSWQPDDSLHGARRDSSVRAHLARKDQRYEKNPDGYTHRYMWRDANLLLSSALGLAIRSLFSPTAVLAAQRTD